MDFVHSLVVSDLLCRFERENVSVLLAVDLKQLSSGCPLKPMSFHGLTQNDPFGFAIFGLHSPVTPDACCPRFFQFRRSVEEYIMGVSPAMR